jgi:hypothetical protein
LQEVCSNNTDLYLLIEIKEEIITIPKDINYFSFNLKTLKTLNYVQLEETIIPGSNHFPVFQFYKSHPQYDYYWNIEYDVFCNGNWNVLFNYFKSIDSDFISSHLERYHQALEWYWWKSLQIKTINIPKGQYIKSFNPIYRISNKAMTILHKFLSEGNSGHHEVLIPTVLNHLGYKINDWGGVGEFVLPDCENSFYLTNSNVDSSDYLGSSMRYRPVFNLNEIRFRIPENNLLYHPVKG